MISLSFLQLNDSRISKSLQFSVEPVSAQLSGQANASIDNETSTTITTTPPTAEEPADFDDFDGTRIDNDRQDTVIRATGGSVDFEDESIPYEEEQVSSIPSSLPSSTMDFGLFLDSFANSIFNGTSTFGAVGTSIVNDIGVSGITLDKSQNRLSVILSNTSAQGGIGNNITGTETTTTTAGFNSVSVIAMRIPINMADILSLAAASSLNDNIIDDTITYTDEIQDYAFSSDSFNAFSFLSSLQLGSSILIDVDWSEPQMVTMDLVGSSGGTILEQQELNSDNLTTTDLVLVSVIPYTGLTNNSSASSTGT
jgi:hypothetical protein